MSRCVSQTVPSSMRTSTHARRPRQKLASRSRRRLRVGPPVASSTVSYYTEQMRRIDHILEEARRLSKEDRTELLERLEELDSPANEVVEQSAAPEGPYSRSMAASGSGHSDFTDVSSDKYAHLGEAYDSGREG